MAKNATKKQQEKTYPPPETLFQLFVLIIRNIFSKKMFFRLILFAVIAIIFTFIHEYILAAIYTSVGFKGTPSQLYDSMLVYSRSEANPPPSPGTIYYEQNILGKNVTLIAPNVILWILWNGIVGVFYSGAFNSYLFWFFLSSIIVGTLTRMYNFGTIRTLKEIFIQFGSLFRDVFSKIGSSRMSKLIFGGIIGLLLGSFVFNAMVSLVLAIVLFLAMSARDRSFLLLVTKLSKSDFHRFFKYKAEFKFDGDIAASTYNGMSLGLLITSLSRLLTNTNAEWLLGISIAAIFVMGFVNLAKKRDGESLAVFLMCLVGYATIPLIKVFADDGGLPESGGTVNGLMHNPGTTVGIKNSIPPGIYAGLNGIFGPALPEMIKKYGGWKGVVDHLNQNQKDFVKDAINKGVKQAQDEAADANSIWGITKQTAKNAKDEIVQAGKDVVDAVTLTGGYIINNPVQAIKNSLGWVKDGVVTVGTAIKDAGEGLVQAGKDCWTYKGLFTDTVKGMFTTVKDGIVTTITDPKKAWEFVKDSVGINNIINSWDSNRGFWDRMGQVGIAVFKGYTTIQTAGQAGALIKAGGSKIVSTLTTLTKGVGGKTVAGVGGKTAAGIGGKAAAGVGGKTAAGVGGKAAAGVGGKTAAGVGGKTVAGVGGKTAAGVGGKTAAGVGGKTAAGVGGKTAAGAGGKTAATAAGAGGKTVGTVSGTPKGTVSVRTPDGKVVSTSGFTSSPKPANPGGMTQNAIKHVQNVADKNGVNIHIRQTNPYSKPWIDSGRGVPKPEFIKSKTVNPYDTLIGAPKNSEGLVAHFKPTKPIKGNMPDDVFKQVQARYDKRLADFNKLDKQIQQMSSGPNPKIKIKDNIIYDAKTGKPYAGDYDIAGITGKNGEPIPKSIKDQIIKDLKNGPANVQHDPLANWPEKLTPENYAKMGKTPEQLQNDIKEYIKQINDHKQGGEGLIQVSAGGKGNLTTSYINVH
ncbi:MAG: hypothetical protein ACM3KR_06965 [Deltaproteobacteria bacterium]